ncbi:hypothetical protein J5J86_24025 [Aquabacter sp. L1I39]|uniref:hypothetical protein n=1 Tax=Aquabacter sp. L1I39 TaxID=2820278 RepID=UPI001ADC2959|nr:hypothetical protein [Aquabacter sp. L1I39]QTL03750.1 hypothetical protein J5J86_24025 [Aquabacter sp. L1I39]
MDTFLKSLTTRRSLLDAEMQAEREREEPDGERILALRRMKHQLGAQIEYIRREGRQIADVMVVRKRRRFADLKPTLLR